MQRDSQPFIPVETNAQQRWVVEEDGRTLGTLLSDLTNDLSMLLRKEIELARVETTEKISILTKSLVWMVIGGLVIYSGFLAMVAGGIMALGTTMSLWLAAIVFSLGLVVLGLIFVQVGRQAMRRMTILPEQAIESIKEDAELVKEKVS
jgi:hypothetical protein